MSPLIGNWHYRRRAAAHQRRTRSSCVLWLSAVVLAVAGCGGGSGGSASRSSGASASRSSGASPSQSSGASASPSSGASPSRSSDQQAIRHVLTAEFAAIAQQNWAGMCNQLSSRGQSALVADAGNAGLSATSCASAVPEIFTAAGGSSVLAQIMQAVGAAHPDILSIGVNGDNAIVTFTITVYGSLHTETDRFVREGGAWKAQQVIAKGGGPSAG